MLFLAGRHSARPHHAGGLFNDATFAVTGFPKTAAILAAVTTVAWLALRHRAAARSHAAEQRQLTEELLATRTRAEATASERTQLAATLRATQDAAEAQRAALQQLSSELGDRLLQQQAVAFETTAAALERRATAESEALRTAYETATAERNERLHLELQPVHETLQRLAETTVATDSRSAAEFSRLVTLVQGLVDEERAHREDTRRIGSALRVSQVRGRFGEWTMQRTLEAAGLQEGVHFLVQPTGRDEEGTFRPDVLVLLPGDRCVVLDSKAPLEGLLDAQHATTQAERDACLERHARALRTHVDQLARKSYAARIAATAPGRAVLDGVILFLPADAVLEAALRRDPQVLQHAASRRVHLVTPTTLLLTLSVVEQLWRQDGRDRRADEIEQLGTDALERMAVVIGHVARLQRHVSETVAAYNSLTASLESRLLPVARRLEELGVRARDSVPSVSEIHTLPRELGPRLESVRVSTTASNPDDNVDGDSRAAA